MIINCKQIREEIDTASRYSLYDGAVASHLNDCPDCLRYSGETASLLGLLSAQPRVEVPTDFEFRLRARISRARGSTASDQRSFLRKISLATFPRGQMITAAAALALIVTVSTFYINRDGRAHRENNAASAFKALEPKSMTANNAGTASGIKVIESDSVGMNQAKFMSRGAKVAPAPFQLEDQFEGQPESAAA
ncbi:MAG: hypothetical protein J2P21_19115, partial [Chloracidobacterium sp.]|nr:hypothetical protein [Chloracidobacterium sp.]